MSKGSNHPGPTLDIKAINHTILQTLGRNFTKLHQAIMGTNPAPGFWNRFADSILPLMEQYVKDYHQWDRYLAATNLILLDIVTSPKPCNILLPQLQNRLDIYGITPAFYTAAFLLSSCKQTLSLSQFVYEPNSPPYVPLYEKYAPLPVLQADLLIRKETSYIDQPRKYFCNHFSPHHHLTLADFFENKLIPDLLSPPPDLVTYITEKSIGTAITALYHPHITATGNNTKHKKTLTKNRDKHLTRLQQKEGETFPLFLALLKTINKDAGNINKIIQTPEKYMYTLSNEIVLPFLHLGQNGKGFKVDKVNEETLEKTYKEKTVLPLRAPTTTMHVLAHKGLPDGVIGKILDFTRGEQHMQRFTHTAGKVQAIVAKKLQQPHSRGGKAWTETRPQPKDSTEAIMESGPQKPGEREMRNNNLDL